MYNGEKKEPADGRANEKVFSYLTKGLRWTMEFTVVSNGIMMGRKPMFFCIIKRFCWLDKYHFVGGVITMYN